MSEPLTPEHQRQALETLKGLLDGFSALLATIRTQQQEELALLLQGMADIASESAGRAGLLAALLMKKRLITEDELTAFGKEVAATIAVERALDPRIEALYGNYRKLLNLPEKQKPEAGG